MGCSVLAAEREEEGSGVPGGCSPLAKGGGARPVAAGPARQKMREGERGEGETERRARPRAIRFDGTTAGAGAPPRFVMAKTPVQRFFFENTKKNYVFFIKKNYIEF